jgi:hypothetical protein
MSTAQSRFEAFRNPFEKTGENGTIYLKRGSRPDQHGSLTAAARGALRD